MRRVEEEFQRKRAREKASIRQQLRLVSGSTSLPPLTAHQQPARDDPDGAVSSSPSPGRGDARGDPRGDSRASPDVCDKQSPYVGRLASSRAARPAEPARRHSKNSSSTHSKSTSNSGPTTRVLSEWRVGGERRQYRDWGAPASIDHPPACYRMPNANHNGNDREFEGFSGSPRSDNYRLEFARGSHGSSSGSELSAHRTSSSLNQSKASACLPAPRWTARYVGPHDAY